MNVPQLLQHEPLPLCIPRLVMPQVDAADYPALFQWLLWRGAPVSETWIAPEAIRFRQRVDWHKIHGIGARLSVYDKPILASADYSPLDGNHRAAAHLLKHEPCRAFIIPRPFAEALALLFSFAGTYTYETPQPERN